MKAYDEFLLNNYTLAGAYNIGSTIAPSDPDYISEKIINRINESYSQVEKSLFHVIRTMKSHRDEFKFIFESEPKQLILFENVLNFMDDDKKIDYNYFGNKTSLISSHYEQNCDGIFINKLNEKKSKISCLIQTNEIEWIKGLNSDILGIVSDQQFQAELSALVIKHLNKKEKK